MFHRMSNYQFTHLALLLLALLLCDTAYAVTPEDDRVAEYLQSKSMNALLEVQLFDRIKRERDPQARMEHSKQLGRIYLDRLADEHASDETRRAYLLKGQVLVGLIPDNMLLELRLELLVEQYKEYEQVADLKRIDLLDQVKTVESIAAMEVLHSMFSRIALVAESDVERFNRQAARTSGDSQRESEQQLGAARAVFSRARFFEGWAGYSLAAINDTKVDSSVIKAFGWVLGFDGNLPVRDEVDLDLLEYDHVARAMIGVALCNLQNGELGSARLWIDAVEQSAIAPDFAVRFAAQRRVDVSLAERDWKRALSETKSLSRRTPDSLLGVSLSRLLVICTMDAMQDEVQGRGGEETATELAKLGLNRLVELGEIGHVIDLLERFGTLPDIGSGFVAYYAQGISELMRADSSGMSSGYMEATVRLNRALESRDVAEYAEYAADAVLKTAYCELRSERPSAALRTLDAYKEFIRTPEQLDESAWLEILALDAVVRSGQEQMGLRLTEVLGEYIRLNPSSERASKLIVQYALSPYLEDVDAVAGLEIEDPTDPLAIPARRKLVQMLYKHPELSDGGREQAGNAIVLHAQWIWDHENDSYTQIREARERLAVCRIAVIMGLDEESTEISFLDAALSQMRALIEAETSFDLYRSELLFREVQVILLKKQIDRAAEIVLGSQELNPEHQLNALSMVFGNAHRRFIENRSVPHAQALVRYGQALIDMNTDDGEELLSARVSLYAESVMMGALYLADETDDSLMREYALALGLRVYELGVPSEFGLLQTAELCEQFDRDEKGLDCWNQLVNTVDEREMNWHRARYESLRLLKSLDPMKAGEVYQQYRTLYPEGSPEPWGSRIKELFPEQQGIDP